MIRNFKLVAALALSMCASHIAFAQEVMAPATSMAAEDSVYADFGGKAGISTIIDNFLVIWKADPRISKALAEADVERLSALLKEQIGQLTGGPEKYSGTDMKTAHEQMGIRNANFNALAEDLQLAMDKSGVPSRAQNKLLSKLAPMEHQIVTK